MELKQKQLLLIVLVLVIVKFAIVPVYEWQNLTISENNSSNLRLVKSNLVIEQLDKMQASVNSMQAKKND